MFERLQALIGLGIDKNSLTYKLKQWKVDTSWTLFLDRDGVINRKLAGAYVRHWGEFEFLAGVLDSIPLLMRYFGRIVVVTNQQGIGKDLMNHEDLHDIFSQLQQAVIQAGGKIDCFYYCPHLASQQCACRKPNTGMGFQAKSDFNDIIFTKSVMVGDSDSDIIFGQKLGMKTVRISPVGANDHSPEANVTVASLQVFTRALAGIEV